MYHAVIYKKRKPKPSTTFRINTTRCAPSRRRARAIAAEASQPSGRGFPLRTKIQRTKTNWGPAKNDNMVYGFCIFIGSIHSVRPSNPDVSVIAGGWVVFSLVTFIDSMPAFFLLLVYGLRWPESVPFPSFPPSTVYVYQNLFCFEMELWAHQLGG